MKRLPIGISDFKKVIEDNYYYVDKTLFIKELIDASGETILIPRPRRFGKTLNISMLRYFFEKTEESNEHLFHNLDIWQETKYQKYQGKYPVIFLTFKTIKENSWEKTYEKISGLISSEFSRHAPTILSGLSDRDRKLYNSIIDQTATEVGFGGSLLLLTRLLHAHYKTKVILLLDEYDAPIHAGVHNNFYKQIVSFMRSLLTDALKDNEHLERAILTGILRTAKEGIFSGLNNLKVASILHATFQDKFGFTKLEVKKLLKDQKLSDLSDKVQDWYNGYIFGKTVIYNPWSLIGFADERGLLKSYWVNTSDNHLIKKIIVDSGEEFKIELEALLEQKTLTEIIDEGIIFPEIEKNIHAIWNLLLYAGYLTSIRTEIKEAGTYCTLKIPNKEIVGVYRKLINEIFLESLSSTRVRLLFKALTTGDTETFAELLQEFVSNSMSVFDIANSEPEKSYHLFVLGLLVHFSDKYLVKSNRESGLGRYDIMLISKTNKRKPGIIIEFKKVTGAKSTRGKKESLIAASKNALQQIKEKNYAQELKELGIKQSIAYGVAFQGKKIHVLKDA